MKSKFEKELKEKAYASVPDRWDEISKRAGEIKPAGEIKSLKAKRTKSFVAAAAAITLVIGAGFAVKSLSNNKITLTPDSSNEKIKYSGSSSVAAEIAVEASSLFEENDEILIKYTDDNGETHTAVAKVDEKESIKSTGKALVTYVDSQGKNQTALVEIPTSGKKDGNSDYDSPETIVGVEQASAHATTTRRDLTVISAEMGAETDWERRTTPGKFPGIIYDGVEYSYPYGYTEGKRETKRSATLIKSGVKAVNYVPAGVGKDTEHTTMADIYSLSGFDKKLVIGVKFKGESNIYPYINTQYKPATLGEFLKAVDYDNTVTYGGIRLMNISMPVNDENKADIKRYLLSDTAAKNDESAALTGSYVTLSVSLKELNINNKKFRVYESGYIQTNLIGYYFTFYVGKDNVESFLKDSYNVTFDELRKTGTTLPYQNGTTAGHVEYTSASSAYKPE